MCLGNIVPYDGQGDGTFCAPQHHSFCRELLDTWVSDVCGVGLTFRKAFYSWKRKFESSCSSINCVPGKLEARRRVSNDAFNMFLNTLRFYTESSLKGLFSFRIHQVQEDATDKIWTGIVMNGTVTGILGMLPKFEQPLEAVPAVIRISNHTMCYEICKVARICRIYLLMCKEK